MELERYSVGISRRRDVIIARSASFSVVCQPFLPILVNFVGVAFLYAYGLALSSPFFMSLGELLNLALAGSKVPSVVICWGDFINLILL